MKNCPMMGRILHLRAESDSVYDLTQTLALYSVLTHCYIITHLHLSPRRVMALTICSMVHLVGQMLLTPFIT